MSGFALISTTAPGPILKRQSFPGDPPVLSLGKGLKWIPDDPPAFNPTTQVLIATEPVPVDALAVSYTVVTSPAYVAGVSAANADAVVERKIATRRAKGDRIGAIEATLKHKGL